MGIPYFFSYIIKAHKNIIKNICFLNEKQIDNFFLDSNSIIYDVVYNIKEYKGFDIEDYIINKVIEKIDNLYQTVKNNVLVSSKKETTNLEQILIKLNDIDGACLDFSKAGELGLDIAYNAIREYCN